MKHALICIQQFPKFMTSYHIQRLFLIVWQCGCICGSEGCDEQENLQTQEEQQHFSVHGELRSVMQLWNTPVFI